MSLRKVIRTAGLISFLAGITFLLFPIATGIGAPKWDFELVEFSVY
ncbi:MAG: hypothetical protein QXX78_07370 [Nitrososphaerota archaeon]